MYWVWCMCIQNILSKLEKSKIFELVYLKIWGGFCEYYKLILCISTWYLSTKRQTITSNKKNKNKHLKRKQQCSNIYVSPIYLLLCMCTEIQKFLPFFVINDKGIKKKKNKYQLGNEWMNRLTRNAKYGCIQTTFK